MTPFQKSLKVMSTEMGVNVSFDVTLDLSDGTSVTAQALFHDFGAPNGTLVFHNFDFFGDVFEELQSLGYTCSEFGGANSSWYDPESLRETLDDWGRWK